MFRVRLRLSSLLLLGLLALPLAASAAPGPDLNGEQVRLGRVATQVWESADVAAEPGGKPVIVFSHGFHGCPANSRSLMQALARAGYVVFAPVHRDNMCAGSTVDNDDPPEVPFARVQDWTDQTYRARVEDIREVVAAAKSSPRYQGRIDWDQLGLMGHSLGGYTVLGMAGGWTSWKLPGVKAVLALSPYSGPLLQQRSLANIAVPVMLQGGTLDTGTTPTLLRPRGTYAQLPSPKYMVEFEGAYHGSWSDGGVDPRPDIAAYTLTFLDRYVRQMADVEFPEARRNQVALFRAHVEGDAPEEATSEAAAPPAR